MKCKKIGNNIDVYPAYCVILNVVKDPAQGLCWIPWHFALSALAEVVEHYYLPLGEGTNFDFVEVATLGRACKQSLPSLTRNFQFSIFN